MSDVLAGLIGAVIGGAAALGGAIVQARSAANTARRRQAAEETRRQEDLKTQAADRRQALTRRYLFGLQDSAESLRRRLENWADLGGKQVAEAADPGYWDVTNLYAVARALAAERVLALEAVYPVLDTDFPDLAQFFKDHGVDRALEDIRGEKLFRYHRLSLAEAALERESDEFRVLIFSEFRHRYEDPRWGLKRLLTPATAALNGLSKAEMKRLEQQLGEIAGKLESVTKVPVASGQEQAEPEGQGKDQGQGHLRARRR
jgi:hypothetical protein